MKIWRGDSDPRNQRKLKISIPGGDGLYSNLIDGGNPLAIRASNLLESVQAHTTANFQKTHYLSFSKEKMTAVHFAGGFDSDVELSDQSEWSAIVAEIDLEKLTRVRDLIEGITHYAFSSCTAQPSYLKLNFQGLIAVSGRPKTTRNILVIDVNHYLLAMKTKGQSVDIEAIGFSENENEVLVLPIDPLPGSVGATAALDLGCISSIEFFRHKAQL